MWMGSAELRVVDCCQVLLEWSAGGVVEVPDMTCCWSDSASSTRHLAVITDNDTRDQRAM